MSRKFTCIVAMPFSGEADANRYSDYLRERVNDKGKPILFVGRETISGDNLTNKLSVFTRYEAFVDHEINWIDDLRGWIAEPDYRNNPAAVHKLDKKQERLATTRTEKGFRRLIGPAGSGKSIVLAHRAANLSREGKSVLVCTFNVTMMNYLRYLVGGCGLEKEHRWKIQFTWFHQWIGEFCVENGVGYPYTREREIEREFRWKDPRRDDPQWFMKFGCVAEAAKDIDGPAANQFDAIIVDEGQDFVLEWWTVLRKALAAGGEMLIAADDAQDVYGSARSWTEERMQGAGFNGKWSRLECNYRLPRKIVNASEKLLEHFSIQRESKALTDGGVKSDRSMFDWVQCDSNQVMHYMHKAIDKLMTWAPCSGYSNTDIVCVVSSRATGIKLRNYLKAKGIDVYDTFFDRKTETGDPTKEERRKKLGFFHTRQMIKITTTESFKGWEARALVFETGIVKDDRTKYGMYIGLTRLARSEGGSIVVVVSHDDSMSEFGSQAENYYDERKSEGNVPS